MRCFAFMLSLALLLCSSTFACPMCKQVLTSSDPQTIQASAGLNPSIYLMLAGVSVAIASLLRVIVRAVRQRGVIE